MSEIRAFFERGSWKDFSREHKELRLLLEERLAGYTGDRCPDPLAVWGAYGAGKTQFLFWVAERACEVGFTPVYLHLNDLVEGLPPAVSPDGFRNHACAFTSEILVELKMPEVTERLAK